MIEEIWDEQRLLLYPECWLPCHFFLRTCWKTRQQVTQTVCRCRWPWLSWRRWPRSSTKERGKPTSAARSVTLQRPWMNATLTRCARFHCSSHCGFSVCIVYVRFLIAHLQFVFLVQSSAQRVFKLQPCHSVIICLSGSPVLTGRPARGCKVSLFVGFNYSESESYVLNVSSKMSTFTKKLQKTWEAVQYALTQSEHFLSSSVSHFCSELFLVLKRFNQTPSLFSHHSCWVMVVATWFVQTTW